MNATQIAKQLLDDANFESTLDFANWNIPGCCSVEVVIGNEDFLMEYSLAGYCKIECSLSVYRYDKTDEEYRPASIEHDLKHDIEESFKQQLIEHYLFLETEEYREQEEQEKAKKDYPGMLETYRTLQYQFV